MASKGDPIAFYETAGEDGRGCKGVVAIGKVSGQAEPNQFHGGEPEVSGKSFRLMMRCDQSDFAGFIPLNELQRIINKKVMVFAGGALELEAGTFSQLVRAFKAGRPATDAKGLYDDHWHNRQ